MDKKLEAYRLRKRRKEFYENFKTKLTAMIPFYYQNQTDENKNTCIIDVPHHESKEKDKRNQLIPPSPSICSEQDPDYISEDDEIIFPKQIESPINPIMPTNKYIRFLYWLIMFLFWATCYAIAIELKFGVVYLLFSSLFGIYFNTRTTPKKHGEISAYSVFNKDCYAIDGTLKAEQFERELRYGPSSVR